VVPAERVYLRVTLEGISHFHTWLIPRPDDAPERGVAFLASERACSEADALAVVARLREILATPPDEDAGLVTGAD
jgi:hypothetical protein